MQRSSTTRTPRAYIQTTCLSLISGVLMEAATSESKVAITFQTLRLRYMTAALLFLQMPRPWKPKMKLWQEQT